MTGKRRTKGIKRRNDRNVLTFYEKLAVIRYHDEQNMSRNSLARMFQCCSTQIRRILEKKEELHKHLATLSEADASIIIEEMTRKRRKFEMSAISFILHKWVERCKSLCVQKSITNETLKDIAAKTAAILNLPAFRPTYRWLNRFRSKYKYEDKDLGCNKEEAVDATANDLSIEDIIIEFKAFLPNFMQKEISVITSSATSAVTGTTAEVYVVKNNDKNNIEVPSQTDWIFDSSNATNSYSLESENCESQEDPLLKEVIYHLSAIEQFAVLNADIRAIELIGQLNDHLRSYASADVYLNPTDKYSSNTCGSVHEVFMEAPEYIQIDDIVLIE